MLKRYKVKYKYGSSSAETTLQLHGGTESEAIAVLKQKNSSYKDKTIIILEIKPA